MSAAPVASSAGDPGPWGTAWMPHPAPGWIASPPASLDLANPETRLRARRHRQSSPGRQVYRVWGGTKVA